MSLIQRFRQSKSGATAIEYGIIIGIIAAFIIGSMVMVRTGVENTFGRIEEGVDTGISG